MSTTLREPSERAWLPASIALHEQQLARFEREERSLSARTSSAKLAALIDLPADAIPRGASWTRDGSSIVIALWQTTGDIILAERSR